MTMLGFMLNYALRVNLTIAIVAMVKPAAHNGTDGSPVDVVEDDSDLFDWDPYQQNFVLGSFFWGYILTELPGGRLAELVGGRRVFGHSMLWASLLTFITPFAAKFSYVFLMLSELYLDLC
uniref:Major facilitator superfamily (MFS) profile domain-containing protein n=1 Tax=Megaselia scalaris TaxID=36166 RepID=T1GHC2_MEGSC